MDETPFMEDLQFGLGEATHCFYSHWNMEGFRFSFRDDLFKLLMVAAYMINGPAWLYHCQSLENQWPAMLYFKSVTNIFVITSDFERIVTVPGLSRRARWLLTRHLRKALDHARSMENLDDLPPYAAVKHSLRAARRVVEASSCVSCPIV
jgi:hypothetical protein